MKSRLPAFYFTYYKGRGVLPIGNYPSCFYCCVLYKESAKHHCNNDLFHVSFALDKVFSICKTKINLILFLLKRIEKWNNKQTFNYWLCYEKCRATYFNWRIGTITLLFSTHRSNGRSEFNFGMKTIFVCVILKDLALGFTPLHKQTGNLKHTLREKSGVSNLRANPRGALPSPRVAFEHSYLIFVTVTVSLWLQSFCELTLLKILYCLSHTNVIHTIYIVSLQVK